MLQLAEKQPLAGILSDYQQNWPEFDRPETRVMLSVIRLNDLMQESGMALISEFGLTNAGFETLATLRGQPAPWKVTPTELSQAVLITSGGMTKVLGQLEQNGFITRQDNPDDQRSRFVCLTKKGKKCAEQAVEAVAEHDREMLTKALSEQQIEQLAKVLMRTVHKLEAQ